MPARLLLAEDEALILIDLCDALEQAGYDIVGPAHTVQQTLQLIDDGRVDIALLDSRLADGSAAPAASKLRTLGIPFVVVSGYPASTLDWIGREPYFEKPYRMPEVLAALRQILSKATDLSQS